MYAQCCYNRLSWHDNKCLQKKTEEKWTVEFDVYAYFWSCYPSIYYGKLGSRWEERNILVTPLWIQGWVHWVAVEWTFMKPRGRSTSSGTSFCRTSVPNIFKCWDLPHRHIWRLQTKSEITVMMNSILSNSWRHHQGCKQKEAYNACSFRTYYSPEIRICFQHGHYVSSV